MQTGEQEGTMRFSLYKKGHCVRLESSLGLLVIVKMLVWPIL
jgi:hypothetical protein